MEIHDSKEVFRTAAKKGSVALLLYRDSRRALNLSTTSSHVIGPAHRHCSPCQERCNGRFITPKRSPGLLRRKGSWASLLSRDSLKARKQGTRPSHVISSTQTHVVTAMQKTC